LLTLRKNNAIHFGEASSQKLNYGGNVNTFNLPNSKVMIGYVTQDSAWLKGIDIRSVEPDVVVLPSSDDHFANKDPVLEAVISYKK
jgi:hypothetical protein